MYRIRKSRNSQRSVIALRKVKRLDDEGLEGREGNLSRGMHKLLLSRSVIDQQSG